MQRLESIALLVAVGLATAACATTRTVKTQPGKGGEIAVHEGIFGDARADARDKMRANCGGKRVEIVEEGEAVVGSRGHTDTRSSKHGSFSTTDSDDKTEWRLKYRCLGRKA